jgi:hypothetical protein
LVSKEKEKGGEAEKGKKLTDYGVKSREGEAMGADGFTYHVFSPLHTFYEYIENNHEVE